MRILGLWIIVFFGFSCASVDVDSKEEDVGHDIETRSAPDSPRDNLNFFAARGRRGGSTGSPDDFFWANRGKKWAGHNMNTRADTFNVPRPNGFFFPTKNGAGKRSGNYMNIPRPNGFFFPSSTGKRNSFNAPKPNGFFFPSIKKFSKRGDFNLPNPNGFMFPTRTSGKRSADDDQPQVARYNFPRPNGFFWPAMQKKSASLWNLAKPNGFFFPSLPKKPTSNHKRTSAEDEDNDDYEEVILDWLQSYLRAENEPHFNVKRSTGSLDTDTFFAGRGKRDAEDVALDIDAFFAGRGKKDDDSVVDMASFFAGRGKKAPQDIFFAGRG